MSFLFGKRGKIKKKSTLSKGQLDLQALIEEGLKNGTGAFGDLFGSFNEQEFEKGVTQPALKNFQENILPQLQEKFIANNQVLGSGLQRAQTKAGSDLASNIAQLKYQAQQDKDKTRLAGLNVSQGTKQFENIYKPGTSGFLPGFAQGAAPAAGNAAVSGLETAGKAALMAVAG